MGYSNKNGLQTWGMWQYFNLGEEFRFSSKAITGAMQKHREQLCRDYLKNTDRLISSEETTREILKVMQKNISKQNQDNAKNFERAAYNISSSFERGVSEVLSSMTFLRDDLDDFRADVANGLENISGAIDGFRADFNWFTNRIYWHLSDIKKTIQMPISNTALNYREHGIHAYQNGWFEEAIRDFFNALKYYEYDFVTHQYLGDIYLYHYKNLKKALDHFSKAARYSATRDASRKQMKISSWAELRVGLVHYFEGRFTEAAKAAYRATEKHASPEALYQLGHYLAMTPQRFDNLKKIIDVFEVAIRKDPVYFFKIDVDQNLFEKELNPLRNEMKVLKTSLFEEEKIRAKNKLDSVKKEFNGTNWFQGRETREFLEEFREDLRQAEEMFRNRQSYLDFRIIQEMI